MAAVDQLPLRAVQIAEATGYRALIATSPANVQYLTDGDTSLLRQYGAGSMLAVWDIAHAQMTLILPAIRLPGNLGFEGQLIPYGLSPFTVGEEADQAFLSRVEVAMARRVPTLVEAVAAALGTTGGAVGVDDSQLTPALWAQLEAALPHQRLESAQATFLAMRAVKTDTEIARMKYSLKEVETAMQRTLPAILTEQSELRINHLFRSFIAERGGYFGAGAICIGSGSGAVLPPSPDVIARPGMLVKWDVAAHFSGYWADTARTSYVLTANDHQKRRYEAVQAAHAAVVAAAKAGVLASDLYRLGQKTLQEYSLDVPQLHVGHGIGLDLYEPPLLSPTNHTPLEAGTVLCLENPIFEIGLGALTLENTVVITADACRILNETPAELIRLSHQPT